MNNYVEMCQVTKLVQIAKKIARGFEKICGLDEKAK